MIRAPLIVLALLVVACGKNEIRSVPPSPAPAPYGSPTPFPPGYQPQPFQYPQTSPCGPQPTMGCQRIPPYGYPYAPIYPYLTTQGMWQPWVEFCGYRGWDPFENFNYFWFEYCPANCEPSVYHYYDRQFYGWMDPAYQFSPGYNGAQFWGAFNGLPIVY